MTQKHVLFILDSLTAAGAERQAISLVDGLDVERVSRLLAYLKPIETLLPPGVEFAPASRLDRISSYRTAPKIQLVLPSCGLQRS